MTISDRIFEKLSEMKMTQKEFSKRTGIPQSTISDWRKKQTNPTADKIMVICQTLNVTPEWILSGIEPQRQGRQVNWYVIDADTDGGKLVEIFNSMGRNLQERLMGYAEALAATSRKRK